MWLLAMPVVPALTVALGLWLVRRTTDIVAGTSISLRVMPAVLGGTGLFAWLLATFTDIGAALVPLGGALLLAGDLWDGAVLPSVLALSSSILATAILLILTARDLDERAPPRTAQATRPWLALRDGLLTGSLWWCLLAGPVLWGWAGNGELTRFLDVQRGLFAGVAMLAVFAIVEGLRSLDPARIPRFGRPDLRTLPVALLVGAALHAPTISSTNPWIQLAAERLQAGFIPDLLFTLPVVLVQELWFRGWIQRRAGWVPAALAWTLAITPLNPIGGLIAGLALGWCAKKGLSSAILARLLALGLYLWI